MDGVEGKGEEGYGSNIEYKASAIPLLEVSYTAM